MLNQDYILMFLTQKKKNKIKEQWEMEPFLSH